MMKIMTIIPARMGSSRLPGKPLADIHGDPMIVHVLRRAQEAALGPVWVACAEPSIIDAVEKACGKAVLTDPDLPSGSDRVRAAVDIIDPNKNYDCVINVQGDMPTLDPALLQGLATVLENKGVDIATAAVETRDALEISDPNVVKAVLAMAQNDDPSHIARALYFSRAALPYGAKKVYHHLGVYAYRRAALDRFCDLSPSYLEQVERLEQLRALEAGMRIDVAIVKSAPHGVDTADDLERARALLKHVKKSEVKT